MSDSDKQCYFFSAEYLNNEKQYYFCLAEFPIMKKYPIFALRNFQKEEVTPKAHSGISAVYNNR